MHPNPLEACSAQDRGWPTVPVCSGHSWFCHWKSGVPRNPSAPGNGTGWSPCLRLHLQNAPGALTLPPGFTSPLLPVPHGIPPRGASKCDLFQTVTCPRVTAQVLVPHHHHCPAGCSPARPECRWGVHSCRECSGCRAGDPGQAQ